MEKDPREIIIDLIVENRKLNSIKIHNLLKKNKYSKSYQNTHKILKKMFDEKILIKTDYKYQINKTWLNSQIKKYLDYKEKLSSKKKNMYSDKSLKIYNFQNILEIDQFWINFVIEEIENNNNINEVYWEGPNCWWLFSNIMGEENYLKILNKNNIKGYFLIKTQNDLNNKAKKFYNDRKNFCVIAKNPTNIYLHRGVVGNKIIEVEYDNKVNELFDEIYKSENQEVFLEKMNKVVNLKSNLTLKIISENELSEIYKNKIKSEF